MDMILTNARILTPGATLDPGGVVIREGRLSYVGPMQGLPVNSGKRIDLQGLFLSPGWIDIHVHGGHGVTFGESQDAEQELRAYSEWVVQQGVTGFLTSLAAADASALLNLVRRYGAVMEKGLPGAEALGIHLEGPFLSPRKHGAFNLDWLRQPSVEETRALLDAGKGWIRQVTLAPELPEADAVAAYLRSRGVVAALGHTQSDYQTASRALAGDFTHVTHTYNAQSSFVPREPGAIGAVLASDKVTAEVIADGFHVHPAALKVLLRCLGPERICLITDAMGGAGLPDGDYSLVGKPVTVRGGHALQADGTIAGSTAVLRECVRNMHDLVGVAWEDAVRMASQIPAGVIGAGERLGSLEVGKAASLVAFDDQAQVKLVTVKGKIQYAKSID